MTLHEQFASLGLMVAAGIWIGACFSVHQRFTRLLRRRRVVLALADLLFWLVQAIVLFAVLLPVNEGVLRVYLFLGLALGYTFYKGLLEKTFLRSFDFMMSVLVRTCRLVAKCVFNLFVRPLYLLLKLTFRLCRMTVKAVLGTVLFLLLLPLKFFRGVIHLVLPDKWLLGVNKSAAQFRERLHSWMAFFRGHR
ncbi:spore cortex biosynthesis protein YabQ [Sporolactobacillus vineae]|uniref:spore cortex biosynthesis protein YabQ n=1 Tax=Sporolactobacillus vineae TaxID=444463 RepID=UPI0002890078|nr:spore cortex biosynthesis protein YabQ [Sporolactobacillus vineae]